ncbi:MAG: hypothetical protein ACHQD8_06705 [Chitinophagales bacterium]
MAYEIKWTSRAKESYDAIIAFLEKEWTEREIKNFVNTVDEKLQLITIYPSLFVTTNKRKHIHKAIINKKVILYYRQHKLLHRIELLLFWETIRDPAKLKL